MDEKDKKGKKMNRSKRKGRHRGGKGRAEEEWLEEYQVEGQE